MAWITIILMGSTLLPEEVGRDAIHRVKDLSKGKVASGQLDTYRDLRRVPLTRYWWCFQMYVDFHGNHVDRPS